jgi:hypothetical protein
MFELFVGDIYESLAQDAKSHNADAELITASNADKFLKKLNKVAYTSLADINNDEIFIQLCLCADKIYYRPSAHWSTVEQKISTENILIWISQHTAIDGLEHLSVDYQQFNEDLLQDKRKTDQSQLWVVGCSITSGMGVEHDQTYREIVSHKLNLEYSDLSCPGSSITWQSDQICRSDIRCNDVVFWGLTALNRMPIFHYDKVMHLTNLTYKNYPELKSKFPIDLLDNNSLLYHNILAVRRAYNFCRKINAKLVILGLLHDVDSVYRYYNVPVFRQLRKPTRDDFVDFGSDNIHPGPEQHKIYADEFLKLYSKLHPAESVAKPHLVC